MSHIDPAQKAEKKEVRLREAAQAMDEYRAQELASEANMLRLRALRLQKEAQDRNAAAAAEVSPAGGSGGANLPPPARSAAGSSRRPAATGRKKAAKPATAPRMPSRRK